MDQVSPSRELDGEGFASQTALLLETHPDYTRCFFFYGESFCFTFSYQRQPLKRGVREFRNKGRFHWNRNWKRHLLKADTKRGRKRVKRGCKQICLLPLCPFRLASSIFFQASAPAPGRLVGPQESCFFCHLGGWSLCVQTPVPSSPRVTDAHVGSSGAPSCPQQVWWHILLPRSCLMLPQPHTQAGRGVRFLYESPDYPPVVCLHPRPVKHCL